MNANEMIDEIEKIFPDAECELVHGNTFQLLCAVILSAQTTDASVNRVTGPLFEAYPDARQMAKASVEEIEPYIQSLGLYHNKAKSLSAMSRDLLERFDGVVPSSYEDLQSLAGVGRKTANVVRSVAFHIPSLAVDTHVERVSKRLGLSKVNATVAQVEKDLMAQIDQERWNQAHHDLIFFGRYLCTAKKPQCSRCPFQGICHDNEYEDYKRLEKEKSNGRKKQKRSAA